jgi:hypothetical protein
MLSFSRARSLTGPSSLAHTCRLTIASAISRSHSRPNAPSISSSRKNTGKIDEKVVENVAEWRFFGGPKRHFAVLRAGCARLQHARPPRPYVHGVRLPRAASGPPDRLWGAIFRGPGHGTTCVRPGRAGDCADFVAHVVRPARLMSNALACGLDELIGAASGWSGGAGRARSREQLTSDQRRNKPHGRGDRSTRTCRA